ncbi:MAG TPA: sulfite exporter TauE/SafE family protein [Candidatus Angelobacter sp.]|nr:sulfite exporter TauE/SafE family protein [Candidatus Angelobacter sp.]
MEILLGFLIGVAIGATGVGGGTLTAPALIVLMGYSPRLAVTTALVYSAAVKLWASGVYLFRRQVDLRVLGYLLAAGVPGTLVGAAVLQRLRSPKTDQWILCIIGAVVLTSASFKLLKPGHEGSAQKSKLHLLPFFAFPISMEIGFSSAGAGALGTLVLFHLTSLAPSVVVGTDLVFGTVVSAVGGSVHAYSGQCNWLALSGMIPAGIVGTLIGTRAGLVLPATILRKAVLLCAMAVAISLICKGVIGGF